MSYDVEKSAPLLKDGHYITPSADYSISGRHGGQLAHPGGRGIWPGKVIHNQNASYSVSASKPPSSITNYLILGLVGAAILYVVMK